MLEPTFTASKNGCVHLTCASKFFLPAPFGRSILIFAETASGAKATCRVLLGDRGCVCCSSSNGVGDLEWLEAREESLHGVEGWGDSV
jgi:hypothetical protein